MTRLSHSAVNTYLSCGRKYKLHYIDKLRDKYGRAALLFGSSLDEALNSLLEGKGNEEVVFLSKWRENYINSKKIKLYDYPLMVYSDTDYDEELLLPEDVQELHEYLSRPGATLDYTLGYDELYQLIVAEKKEKGFEQLRDDQKSFFNYCNWLCLKRKGLLMLVAYKEKIMPNIEQVYAVQKRIEIENFEGDTIVGSIDLHCKWRGVGEVILDNKTAARAYDNDAVLTSQQLSLYCDIMKVDHGGFIVLKKGIKKNKIKICSLCNSDGSGKTHKTCPEKINKKRCDGEWKVSITPEVDIQILIDKVPTASKDLVMQTFDAVNEAVSKKIFTPNINSCIMPYGRCQFYKVCHKNSKEDVEEVR